MNDPRGEITVAVAGQPNSGKSTIFNMLTGARQHVANYPGVTIEKRSGKYSYKGDTVILVDLPGTYSLTSYSQEERIATDFLLYEKPAVVLDIIDASNLERNLYLTFQLQEMGMPLIIALNMMDVAEARGLRIDTQKLSELLKVPVIATVGNKGKGKEELKTAIINTRRNTENNNFRIDYGEKLEPILSLLEKRLSEDLKTSLSYPVRWLAVKLMENDSVARRLVEK
ncbi:MAG: 50S ribosome-binding GTPase, partial [Deltaproteobacteria bacterium]|nr:50S ribosome-binding GTPase [Deltaproteobacteria bacterium]